MKGARPYLSRAAHLRRHRTWSFARSRVRVVTPATRSFRDLLKVNALALAEFTGKKRRRFCRKSLRTPRRQQQLPKQATSIAGVSQPDTNSVMLPYIPGDRNETLVASCDLTGLKAS